jgi:transposase-like protein
MEPKATAIAAVKQEMRIQEWTSQIEAQQSSGKTVKQWCAENGIKPTTYYNRLQKVRSRIIDSAPAIVPLKVSRQSEGIHIEKNGVQISLPTDIAPETLLAVVRALC